MTEQDDALRAELEQAKRELGEARLRIEELELQLEAAHRQLAAQDGGAPADAEGAGADKRTSITIPPWLHAGAPAAEAAGSPAADSPGGGPAADLVPPASHPPDERAVRFTVDQMPEWLRSASVDVLTAADEADDADDREGGGADGARAPEPPEWARRPHLSVVTFDELADGARLEARVVAHIFVRGHIEHEVRVSLGSRSWEVYRRYREFRRLHEQLQAAAASDYLAADSGATSPFSLEPFAVPKLFLHTPAMLRERERRLEALLAECIAKARQAQRAVPVLERFLGLHFASEAQSPKERTLTKEAV
jgi:hypothetical protein